MKKILFGLTTLILASSACTNLDENLYDKIPGDLFPENPTQVANLGTDAYIPMKEFNDNGGWWFCQEVTTDEMVAPTRGTDWDDNGKWRSLQLHTWDYETEAVVNMWERYYRGIFNCNKTIFTQLGDSAVVNTDGKTSLARMYSLRAFYHWLAMDNYGDVPLSITFSNEDQPFKTKRASIYKQIVSDLKWSIQYLNFVPARFSASKGMAQMTLARLYLNSKVYIGVDESELAIPVLEDLIANGGYTLATTVKAPFATANENCSENIYTAFYDGTEDIQKKAEFNSHMRTVCYDSNLQFKSNKAGWNGFATTEVHYNSYPAGDLRKAAWFQVGPQTTYEGAPLMDVPSGGVWNFTPAIPALEMLVSNGLTLTQVRMSGARMLKYEIAQGSGQSLANDFVFFRLADAYLMLAECYALKSNAAKVQEYLDPIRTRAGLGAPVAYDLDAVKLERRLELFYEGTRRQDMIRWGIFNTPWPCAWQSDINTSNNNVFPIPKKQITANPNLDPAVAAID